VLSVIRSLGHLKEESSASHRAIDRPGQGLQCVISHFGKGSSDSGAPTAPNYGGKLFFYGAKIFLFRRWPKLGPIPRYGCSIPSCGLCRCVSMTYELVLSFQAGPNVGELDALFMAPAHGHRIHNTN
jgi:hypothetical protein